MQFILFLRQLLLLPVDFVRFIFNSIRDFQNATPRVKAFLFSLPAIFTAVFGLVFLGIVTSIRESTLLTRYSNLAEQINTEFNQEYSQFLKYSSEKFRELVLQANPEEPFDGQKVADTLNEHSQTKEMRSKLIELRRAEIMFREKLIHLQPSNDEYRFQHAMAHQHLDDQRMLTLLTAIAPTDRPGHLKAHLWLAEYYFLMAANQPGAMQARLYSEAITHATNALMMEKENQVALRIKGDALFRIGRYEMAAEVFNTLVKLDPANYLPVVELNELRGVPATETEIFLRSMKIDLGKKMKINRAITSTWEKYFVAYINCLLKLEDFADIKREIDEERMMGESYPDSGVRKRIIDNIWAHSLLSQNRSRISNLRKAGKPMTAEFVEELLKNYREVLAIIPDSPDVKRQVVSLAVEYPDFKPQFQEIYDAEADPNPPAFVVDRLGVAELLKQNYASAIQYLKRALELAPDDPTIMNNLAFAYLSFDTPEGVKQALWYSEMALKALDRLPQIRRNQELMSSFNHTRGAALMAGGQYAEAVGFFENALIGRPNHRGSVEALVKCLSEIGSPKAREYQEILKELDKQN